MDRSRSITRPPSQSQLEPRSPKSRVLAALMCFFFGVFGVHRFYVGKFWTGLLLLATGGGFGVWWLVDLVIIALGRFKDAEDRVLGPPQVDEHKQQRRRRLEDSRDRQPPHRERRRDRRTDGTDGTLERSRSDQDEVRFPEANEARFDDEGDELLKDPLEEEFEKLEQEMDERS